MNSDVENPDLVQVLTSLKKSEEFLFLRNKKVTHQKKKNNYLFITFFFTKPVRTKK